MKIVVTGGSGKFGRWVVRELISGAGRARPHDVTVFDRAPCEAGIGVRYLPGDIVDLGHVVGALAGADAVIHLAGIPTHSVVPNEDTFRINTMGTFNVHEAAWRLGIDCVVTMSSEAVLGWAPGAMVRETAPEYLPIDEDHPVGAQDAYGLSKIACEAIARSYAAKCDMTAVVLRPPWIASPDEMLEVHQNGGRPVTEFGPCHYIDARDLAAACHRRETYKFEKLLYVVGTAQSLHFRQLFKVLELMEEPWAKDCVHVNFGLVQGMSSRKGNVIYLEELLDEARNRAQEYMSANVDKRPDLEDEEAVAEAVGIAAIFFSDLSKQRIKDYNFSWERAISFEGDTGPYLMNAHARIAGIIRKCGVALDREADVTLLQEQSAHDLVSLVSRYTDALREAAKNFEPSILAAYLLDLARALHSGYKELRVKGEEEKLAGARLLLLAVVKNVLASGMRILGIKPLEKM